MKDAILLEIASAGPQDKESLAAIPGLSPRTLRRAGKALLGVLGDARGDNIDYEPPQKPNEKQKAILNGIQAAVATCAEELKIAAEIIAPKKELSASLNGDRESRVFTGWRREVIGNTLLEMFED